MKTAIELAEGKPSSIDDDLYAWATEASAMLLRQAGQIERLQADLTTQAEINRHLARENAVERDALKADAERLDLLESTFFAKRWNGVIDSGSQTTWRIVPGYQHSTHLMIGRTFRAAIDAMKGKS